MQWDIVNYMLFIDHSHILMYSFFLFNKPLLYVKHGPRYWKSLIIKLALSLRVQVGGYLWTGCKICIDGQRKE